MFFSVANNSDRLRDPPRLPFDEHLRSVSEVMWPRRVAGHSDSSAAEVNTVCTFTERAGTTLLLVGFSPFFIGEEGP